MVLGRGVGERVRDWPAVAGARGEAAGRAAGGAVCQRRDDGGKTAAIDL